LLLTTLLLASSFAQYIAQAFVKGTSNDQNVSGTVTFQKLANGNITVTVNVTGITVAPNDLHGIHVHNLGDISDPAGLNTTGHWVGSLGNPHACPENGSVRHFGDMGNWQATAGSIQAVKVLDLLQLDGIDSIIGRAVIVHSQVDDCFTPPTGNAGTRLAQGVVGIVNSTTYGGSGEAVQQINTTTSAIAVLTPAAGNVTGTVWFLQPGGIGPVTVYARIEGITGDHAMHIHWFGDISSPTGANTYGHYNPLGAAHGVPPFLPRHIGDLGIITYYNDSVAYYQYTNDLISLNGANNIIGRAVHVHANSDNCVDPVGNGGGRLAQGVIGIASISAPVFPDNVPKTQNGTTICQLIQSSAAGSSAAAGTSNVISTNSNTAINGTAKGTTKGGNTGADSGASTLSFFCAFIFVAIALFC